MKSTKQKKKENKSIKVGCCGFPTSREKYFKEFDIVELQNTFYSIPSLENVKKLKEEALKINKNFEFCIKSFQVITHKSTSPTYKKLKEKFGNPLNYGFFQPTKEVFEAWEKTKEIAKILDTKIILFQTPASFTEEERNIRNMKEFFSSIKKEKFIFAWEARGWSESKRKEVCEELKLISAVDPFKEKAFGEINYFRLHGLPGYNLRYVYSSEDLEKLKSFCDKKQNYVFFNNLQMLKNATQFKQIL
jgi:uncharacterized protein YecE (DUF72 family)